MVRGSAPAILDGVHIRDGWQEPDPEPAAAEATGPPRWRVPPMVPLFKLAGATVFALVGLLVGRGSEVAVALIAAAGLGLWALRDLFTMVRLSADEAGVTVVSGLVGRRRIGWERVEAITVDTRQRLGRRTETLEIDTGDTLHLFGPYDLGASPTEVARRLERLRAAG